VKFIESEPEGYFVCNVETYGKYDHWWGHVGVRRDYGHYSIITFEEQGAISMSKQLKKIEEASRLITAGIAVLLGVDAPSVADAVEEQKANTKVRETGTDDEEEAPKKKRGRPAKLKPPVADDDDEDEDDAPAKKPAADDDDDDDEEAEGATIPKDTALKALDRTGLKKIAIAHGIDPAGKNYDDLLQLLKEARDGKKSKGKEKSKSAADDDDDDGEDEDAPAKSAKSGKAKAPAGPDDDDYPSLKEMKRDLEAFFKLNKSALTDMGFFGGKPKKGVTALPNTYEEVMGDKDLIKEAWADNVWEHVNSGAWDKMKTKAAAIEDDDDE
jgi:hypothetical protein